MQRSILLLHLDANLETPTLMMALVEVHRGENKVSRNQEA